MVNFQNTNSHTDPTRNPSSVYFLHPSDSAQKIVNIAFSGRGFSNWRRVMTIALSGKNKSGFVDGSLPRPTSSSGARAWDRVDNVVMGWIIAVLEDSIANSILSYKTSKEIWEELGERYGQSSNAQMFSLQEELNSLVQAPDMTVSEFFTKMKTLWDEFDALNPVPTCNCTAAATYTCDVAKKIYKMQQNTKVISFLMKLDKRFKQVRSQYAHDDRFAYCSPSLQDSFTRRNSPAPKQQWRN